MRWLSRQNRRGSSRNHTTPDCGFCLGNTVILSRNTAQFDGNLASSGTTVLIPAVTPISPLSCWCCAHNITRDQLHCFSGILVPRVEIVAWRPKCRICLSNSHRVAPSRMVRSLPDMPGNVRHTGERVGVVSTEHKICLRTVLFNMALRRYHTVRAGFTCYLLCSNLPSSFELHGNKVGFLHLFFGNGAMPAGCLILEQKRPSSRGDSKQNQTRTVHPAFSNAIKLSASLKRPGFIDLGAIDSSTSDETV